MDKIFSQSYIMDFRKSGSGNFRIVTVAKITDWS